MRSLFFSRATLVWVVLVLATAASWALGHGESFSDYRYAGTVILVITFMKVRLVILDFMEIRHAPVIARYVAEVWVTVLCATLVTLFLHSPNAA